MKSISGFFVFCILIAACSTSPSEISYGKDQCAYCKMIIVDSKFGAELITDKGRISKFDAIECMVNYIHSDAPAYHSLLATPYDIPGRLHLVDSLIFIVSPEYKSPMGVNLAAFSNLSALPENEKSNALNWKEVMSKFDTK